MPLRGRSSASGFGHLERTKNTKGFSRKCMKCFAYENFFFDSTCLFLSYFIVKGQLYEKKTLKCKSVCKKKKCTNIKFLGSFPRKFVEAGNHVSCTHRLRARTANFFFFLSRSTFLALLMIFEPFPYFPFPILFSFLLQFVECALYDLRRCTRQSLVGELLSPSSLLF